MPLPETPRVIYAKNPLEAVICQLRFPPILRIAAELPAAFQERIREEYPLLRERPAFAVPAGIPPQMMMKAIPSELSVALGGRTFDFLSADEKWQLSLNQQHLVLTTTSYERWEGFRIRLDGAHRSLLEIYRPSFYSRMGLRYRDVIRRSVLGLSDIPWYELLSPAIAGELASPLADEVEHAAREFVLRLPDSAARVRVRHGLIGAADSEARYVIDADFYNEPKTETADAFTVLDTFNKHAGRLFRWCISDRLHDAMEPWPAC
ncbi:MAG TPA: TIGR04255 family protein [Pirellulales bacterium]|nr:TIGR04255 family protein [Pirellulales bacterium]